MRGVLVALVGAAAVMAAAFHEGDMIYGAVGGQIVVVDPTNAATAAQKYDLRRRARTATSPPFLEQNVGWDMWSDPHPTITQVREATLVATYISPGLEFRDALHSYFQPYSSRSSFRLQGVSRHKHFSIFTYDVTRPRTYTFRWKLINAIDVNGMALANSPEYTMLFQAPGTLVGVTPTPISGQYGGGYPMGGGEAVPEPGTLLALGVGLAWWAKRKRR